MNSDISNQYSIQERFSAIIESSDDAIMSKTLEGVITSWNPAAERIFGYKEHEAIGRPMLMLLPEELKYEENEILTKISNGERIDHFETVRVRKDGTKVNISASISPIFDRNGKVCGASKIVRDISDKIAIQTIQERFSAIIESSDDAIMSKTLEGVITSWNPAAERIFGYKEHEAIGRPMLMLLPEELKYEENEILIKISNGERIDHFETVRVRKDGTKVNISASISPIFDRNGKVCGASKIVRDISNRIAIEEELRQHREHLEELVILATSEVNAIIQTAVNGVISIDERGIIHLFNPAAEKLFGWKSEEVLGENVSILMPEPFSSNHDGFLTKFVKTGEKHIIGIGREVICLRKGGETFPGHLALGHAELSGGTHLFVAFIADISLQKKAEKELLREKKNAEIAVKTKASFLANMSHEIRTPMNAVIGFAELTLQDESLSPESKKHVKTILNSGNNLLTVIDDILDFSKIEAGKINLEIVCFHLINAVKDALQTLEFKAIEKGLEIKLDFDKNLPLYFMGDPTRLRQVFLNLVSNAIKFTEKGHLLVSIYGGNEPDMLNFMVADTGIGMSAEQVDKIFEPFTQADSSTTRRYGGTGLGTSICQQIVELMGGRIWAKSIEGKGSTFYFTAIMPIAKDSRHALYEDCMLISDDFICPRCFNILLAEDIEENATLVILRLSKIGHHVTWVKNGQEALEAVQNKEWDIVLMDVQMPILDGLQATKKIRLLEQENGKHLTIIALTASIMKEDRDQCIDSGMDIVVGKPIDFNKMLEEIEGIVPLGVGKQNSDKGMIVESDVVINFSMLNSVLDSSKGLASWRDPLIYARALVDFSNKHTKDAAKIKQLLNDFSEDIEPAHRVLHALKGLAGNLALTTVFSISSEIIGKLKKDNNAHVDKFLVDLEEELQKSAEAIALLHIPEKVEIEPKKEIDPQKVIMLLKKLVNKLDNLNPDEVELFIPQLAVYIDQRDLEPILHQVENFDFDSAKSKTFLLADKLNLVLDD